MDATMVWPNVKPVHLECLQRESKPLHADLGAKPADGVRDPPSTNYNRNKMLPLSR